MNVDIVVAVAYTSRKIVVFSTVSVAALALAFGASSAVAIPGITATSTGTVITALPTLSVGAPFSAEGVAATSSALYVVVPQLDEIAVYGLNGAVGTAIPLPVGDFPTDIALSPDGLTAYVTDNTHGNIEKVDLAASSVTTFATTTTPYGVVVSPDGNTVYVLNNSDYQVYAYSASTGAALANSTSNGNYATPFQIGVSSDGSKIYVSYRDPIAAHPSGGVRVLDASTLVETSEVDLQNAQGLAVEKSGDVAVGTNDGAGHGTIVELSATGVATGRTVAVGNVPNVLLTSPDGSTVYDADEANGDLYAIAQSSFTATGSLGPIGNARALASSPDGLHLYAAGGSDHTVYPFSVAGLSLTGPASVATGTPHSDFVAQIADGTTPVANYSTGSILFEVLNSSNAVVASGIASPDATTGAVTVPLDLSTLPAGTYSARATLTFDPGTGTGKVVTVISGITIAAALPVTGAPDETVPFTVASASLLLGLVLTLIGWRNDRVSASVRHRSR